MNFRFLSLRTLAERAWQTFARFPLPILAAFAAATAATLAVEDIVNEDALIAIVLTASLGIPLLIALRLLAESRAWPLSKRVAAEGIGVLALAAYYLILPAELRSDDYFRFFVLDSAALLCVAFVPFIGLGRQENGFWQHNRIFFLRFSTAVLYSTVLFVGLALALAACEALLGFDVDEDTYVELWFWIAFAYNTWFFLAGVPKDVKALETVREYPRGLKIFTQYVLIPLVAVYVLILYAYLSKIIIQWELPKGWVGYPIIGVSVAGMLTLLLMHPVRETAENAWVNVYGRFFYLALYPLVGLIAVAIATRIGDYGITEQRYLIVALTLWLFAMATFYTVRSRGSIRVIPVSLCAVLVLTAFGPWGAIATSRRSQLGRLHQLLITTEVMRDGKLSEERKVIGFEEQKQISNIAQYLHDVHGLSAIGGWYAAQEEAADTLTPQLALEKMGLEYISRWQRSPRESFSLFLELPATLLIEDFDVMYTLSESFPDESAHLDATFGDGWRLRLDEMRLRIWLDSDSLNALTLDLAPWVLELRRKYAVGSGVPEAADAIREVRNERYRAEIHLTRLQTSGESEDLRLTQLNAHILLGLRER